MVIIDNIHFELSEKPSKKLKAYHNGKWIYFGDPRYNHFYDLTELLPINMNHYDLNRRSLYRKRSRNIKNKYGEFTFNNPNYANYYSYHYLW